MHEWSMHMHLRVKSETNCITYKLTILLICQSKCCYSYGFSHTLSYIFDLSISFPEQAEEDNKNVLVTNM